MRGELDRTRRTKRKGTKGNEDERNSERVQVRMRACANLPLCENECVSERTEREDQEEEEEREREREREEKCEKGYRNKGKDEERTR